MTSMRITRVAAPVRAQVLINLRAAVLEGRFQPGERLIERELCDLTGASRTSVREALRQLESEGLVTTVANRGIVVTELDAKQAADLYAVRASLEGLAARLFTERADRTARERLGEVLGQIADAYRSQDPSSMLTAKHDFYHVLLTGADNTHLTDTLALLHARVHQLRAVSLTRPGRTAESLAELREIVDAIHRDDATAAARAATAHVMAAYHAAVQVITTPDGRAPAPKPPVLRDT